MPHVINAESQYVTLLWKRHLVALTDKACQEDGVSRATLVGSVMEAYLKNRGVKLTDEESKEIDRGIIMTKRSRKFGFFVPDKRYKHGSEPKKHK